MSADFRAGHYRAWGHLDSEPPYIAVFDDNEGCRSMGAFTRQEIAELVELAEQAWPGLTASLRRPVAHEDIRPGRYEVTRSVVVTAADAVDAAHSGLYQMSMPELPAVTVTELMTGQVTDVDLNADET